MTYITDTITYPHYHSKAFTLYFKGMKLGAADIETTGLNPEKCSFVLGGLLTEEKSGLKAHQFFAEDLSLEQETLQAYLSALKSCDVLLTYNGHRFDLPFIRRRAGSCAEMLPYNLDLYLLVKNYSPIQKFLPNLKQKTVENFMGLWEHRRDEISGGESVALYYQYLSQREPCVKQTILLHNHDDIIQLYRLLWVLEKCDLHKALYYMGFPVCTGSPEVSNLIVENISFSKDQLAVKGRQGPKAVSYRCFEWDGIPCSAQFSASSRTFTVFVPIIRHSGMTLVDLQTLKLDISVFEKYPGCQEGFLILEEQDQIHYLEINHFVKVCLERILNQWITKKSQEA
ncbi:MAG: ribonuclease H-like domain-containing protein [Firmicutes bacterium]|nr:ribonuclease H-like domain-containing protein [Bacillota bacterium]